MSRGIVLGVFAHPDDETLLAGPLLAKWVSDGFDVRVLSVSGGHDDRYERFLAATGELGVSTVYNLRYDGTAHRAELGGPGGMAIADAPLGELASRILGRIEEVGPSVVVTHSEDGDYGHPDHSAVHSAVVRAVDRYGSDRLELHALAWPGLLPRMARKFMAGEHGEPVRHTRTIGVGEWVSSRRRAARHYRTEIGAGPLPMRLLEGMPAWAQRFIFGKAHLTKIRPRMDDGRSVLD